MSEAAISKKEAIAVLAEDARKIEQLIKNQKNHLCLTACPAFEEVVDTQMYGFSIEIKYAVNIGIISDDEGHKMLSTLEKSLNDIYTEVYDEQKEIK